MPTTPEQKLDPLSAIVFHFGDRLFLVFSYPLFFMEFRKDLPLAEEGLPDFRTLYTLPTIRASCLCTTLLALRDIDDILAPRTKDSKPDDLKASDLGFPKASPFLTQSERQIINKFIIHSTHLAAEAEGRTGLGMQELLSKGVAQSLHFLTWIKDSYKEDQKHARAWAAAHTYIVSAQAIIKRLDAFRDRQAAQAASKGQQRAG